MRNLIHIVLQTPAILTSGLLFQACNSYKGDKACSQFKSGDFVYKFRGKEGDFLYYISRKDSIQTETNSKTGDITKLFVSWIDECNYTLRILESTVNYPDSTMRRRKRMVLKNEIIGGTSDYYLFKSKVNNSGFILSDTMWIKK